MLRPVAFRPLVREQLPPHTVAPLSPAVPLFLVAHLLMAGEVALVQYHLVRNQAVLLLPIMVQLHMGVEDTRLVSHPTVIWVAKTTILLTPGSLTVAVVVLRIQTRVNRLLWGILLPILEKGKGFRVFQRSAMRI